ncbi:SusD/RagB family nutrient-binding outer membrane lipoprotein [Sediminitomix flava]|uniref:SusD/RagB-like outer membrane lipoprotein n=1 Tax=Sediminitomix flava TaxID=379075 RepID=A0A315ZHH4_SEDFL|nr:SusD/RagB family nutrient-binding outer membrane lipoprotein [Sediminitomix flava]PWJ45026.1 SusD/RagB-like outer membrane lipoprotein [Sediminitomix flava]
MKKINKLFTVLSLALASVVSGCDSYVDGYEIDPARALESSMDVKFSSAIAFSIYVQSDQLARYISMVTQQVTGADRQFLAAQRYNIQRGDFNDVWGSNGYAGAMKDLQNLMTQAEEAGATHYLGVAKVMLAFNLGLLTDSFGDIPYSEAFQGTENLKPKYDSQEAIYAEIDKLLTDAIADFAAESTNSPSGDDLIFGGDLAMWTKFAYGMKARYLNHLSELSQYDADAVLAALGNAFASNADDAELGFYSSTLQSNPWNQFLVQRDGYIALEGTMFDMMTAKSDPRQALYGLDGFYLQATAPVALMTYAEAKFIEAEALHHKGQVVDAETALIEAVTAHMTKVGVEEADITAYVATLTAAGVDYQTIMEEKYVALYTHPEAWTDWRRSGYPMLTPDDNSELSAGLIPTRFPYPETEYLYNVQNVPDLDKEAGLTQKLWWDAN